MKRFNATAGGSEESKQAFVNSRPDPCYLCVWQVIQNIPLMYMKTKIKPSAKQKCIQPTMHFSLETQKALTIPAQRRGGDMEDIATTFAHIQRT